MGLGIVLGRFLSDLNGLDVVDIRSRLFNKLLWKIMNRLISTIIILLFPIISNRAYSEDIFPWRFGISQQEVEAVAEWGPYKSFSNGDLETYNAIYEGEKKNFQFFFENNKLKRIGVYFYEGADLNSAASAWLSLHTSMSKKFGAIETLKNELPSGATKQQKEKFKETAIAIVNAEGKTQMAPKVQPNDAFAFSSLMRGETEGKVYYYVMLNFDKRP